MIAYAVGDYVKITPAKDKFDGLICSIIEIFDDDRGSWRCKLRVIEGPQAGQVFSNRFEYDDVVRLSPLEQLAREAE